MSLQPSRSERDLAHIETSELLCSSEARPAEDERDSSGDPGAGPSSPWPSWLSKDDVVTVAVALGISYGIRWCAADAASSCLPELPQRPFGLRAA